MNKTFLILGAMLIVAQPLVAGADIFDKAEAAKACIQNGNCEKAGKWTKRFKAFSTCQAEGNCTEKAIGKANETIANNQDKIVGAVNKVDTLNNCANTQDPVEQQKCYEMAKGKYRDWQAKKEEKAQEAQALANQPKRQGDAVCMSGRMLPFIKVKVKGYVERIEDNRIQIRIADTQSQSPRYNGESLWPNKVIWDEHNNWTQC